MPSRRLIPIAAVPAAAAAAALLLGGSASGQDPAAQTLSFRGGESTFTHIRNTKGARHRANTQGDVIVSTQRLLGADGKRAGTLAATCITTRTAKDFRRSIAACSAVVTLRDGMLTLQAPIRPNQVVTGAVTGGTGRYASAHGTFSSSDTETIFTLQP